MFSDWTPSQLSQRATFRLSLKFRKARSKTLFHSVNFAENIRLRSIALKMRELLSPVVVDLECAVVLGILHQQFDRFRSVLRSLEGVPVDIPREFAPVDRQHFHPRSNSRFRRRQSLRCVENAAVRAQIEAQRKSRINLLMILFCRLRQLRRNVVKDQFPSTVFETRERRPGPVIGQPLGPELAPVIRSDSIQSVHHVVKRVSFHLGRTTRTSMENVTKIIDRLRAAALLP